MEELVPSQFFLSQNFPNPFTNDTKIKYCLPVRIKVNITVYNSDGVKVKELVNKIQDAGTYEVRFASHSGESLNLPAGSYYYRMQVVNADLIKMQSFIETKKMMLLEI